MNSVLDVDLTFLTKGEKTAKEEYEKALKVSSKRESTLMELAWNSTGFTELVKQAKEFRAEVTLYLSYLQKGEHSKVKKFLPPLTKKLLQYLHGLFTKRRNPTSHLLIFMISDELRNHKPYAVPVRFLTYKYNVRDEVPHDVACVDEFNSSDFLPYRNSLLSRILDIG